MSLYVNIPPSSSGTSWYSLEAAVHAAAVPSLTESVAITPGLSHDMATIGANAQDAGVEGGALRGINSAWNILTKQLPYRNVSTSKFAISFQGSLASIAAAQLSYFGLINAAATHELIVGTQQSVSGTQFLAFTYNGVAVVPAGGVDLGTADTNVYTWRIISDATTVTFSRSAKAGGGAALSSGTVLTNVANFPTDVMAPGFLASTASAGQALYKAVYSYVGP